MFFKKEGEDVRKIIGGVRDRPPFTISITIGLLAISTSLGYLLLLVLGGDGYNNLIKLLPLSVVLYLIIAGSFIAGVCEELV